MIVLTCTLVPHAGREHDAREACLELMRESAGHQGLLRYFWTEDEDTGAFHLVEVHQDEASVFNHIALADVTRLVAAGTVGDIRVMGDAGSPELRALLAGFGEVRVHPTIDGGSAAAPGLAAAEDSLLRRVVVGLDAEGRSAVVSDARDMAHVLRPTGALVQDVWRVEQVPADPAVDGACRGEVILTPPEAGAMVRLFLLPPDSDKGRYGADASQIGGPVLGRTDTIHIGTVVSGRAYAILEAEEVLLAQGDVVVMPGSAHAWRNPFDEEFVVAFLSAPRLPVS